MLQGPAHNPHLPLWPRTADALRTWLAEHPGVDSAAPLFLNASCTRIGRSGIAHIVARQVEIAGIKPRHTPTVSPHVLRHTTEMHLLKSDVDITTIAAWLGHADLSTARGYVEIDLRMKQAAVDDLRNPVRSHRGAFPTGDLLT